MSKQKRNRRKFAVQKKRLSSLSKANAHFVSSLFLTRSGEGEKSPPFRTACVRVVTLVVDLELIAFGSTKHENQLRFHLNCLRLIHYIYTGKEKNPGKCV